MTSKRIAIIFALTAFIALLAGAVPAGAQVTHRSYTYGPITIGPYQVKQSDFDLANVKKPADDGFITHMDVDVVDPQTGKSIPIYRIMLHHIVFSTLGRKDATCEQFTALDSRTKFPAAAAERFYARGEEGGQLDLPHGYGYPVKGSDLWLLTYMLMNHRNVPDTVKIKYNVTYDTNPDLTPVKPYWLDVRNCLTDPVFNVPGGGKRGSTYSQSADWTAPQNGHLVAGGGHVHGGAKNLVLSEPDCGNRKVFTSKPTWGLRNDAFYKVRPKLHEPGPRFMSGFNSVKGLPVAKGERLRLTANYDGELAHTRVMGIMITYFAPDNSVQKCGPAPNDVTISKATLPGRLKTPRYIVPLTGIRNGKAVTIKKPPGRFKRLGGDASIDVGDLFFSQRNLSIPSGAKVSWTFEGSTLHNVTLANGPRGFASVHLSDGRVFSQRLRKPGTYQLFCALHPVTMVEEIKVRRR